MNEHFNIASSLSEMAKKYPDKRAVISQKDGTHYTFGELEKVSNSYACGFLKLGIKKGDRIVLMVRPGRDFIAITFALFKTGAVPVLIDPGMGKENLFRCIAEVEPKGFIAVPMAHALRAIHKIFLRDKSFKTVKHFITVGRKWFWGGVTLDAVARLNTSAQPLNCSPPFMGGDKGEGEICNNINNKSPHPCPCNRLPPTRGKGVF